MNVGVFVLGMHRSGTSAATRLVNLLGLPTCIEDDLSPPSFDNPKRHWESMSLIAFNDRVLETLGCDWSCPVALEPGWESDAELGELREEATGLFPRVVPSEQWVWKDPRNCLTLPFWLECVGARPLAVLIYRNPLEVAASLRARDGFPSTYALALWERYVRASLVALAGLPTFVTRYVDVLSDPIAWSRATADFLRGAGVDVSRVRKAEIRRFVDRGLRHAEASPADLERDSVATEEQVHLFRTIEALRGVHAALPMPQCPESSTTESLLAERRLAYATRR